MDVEKVVPIYRFYQITEAGKRSPSVDISCVDDVAAIVLAGRSAVPPGTCEVWLGARSVGSSLFVAAVTGFALP